MSNNTVTDMIKEHGTKHQLRKGMQEKRKSEAVVAAQAFNSTLVDHLNAKVSRAYHNQKRIDVEAKRVEKNSEQLSTIGEQWMEMINSFSYALKEIGNVETWSRVIEKDTTIIARTLEHSHKATIEAAETEHAAEATMLDQPSQQEQNEERKQQSSSSTQMPT